MLGAGAASKQSCRQRTANILLGDDDTLPALPPSRSPPFGKELCSVNRFPPHRRQHGKSSAFLRCFWKRDARRRRRSAASSPARPEAAVWCAKESKQLRMRPPAQGSGSLRKGPRGGGWRCARLGRMVSPGRGDVKGMGCCCSPGAGGQFAACPGNSWCGCCLHSSADPKSRSLPVVPIRLKPGSAEAGWFWPWHLVALQH